MPKIIIDGIEYHSEDLSEAGQAQFQSLQFLEVQMHKLQQELAVYKTAQATYAQALKAEIEKAGLAPVTDAQSDD